MDRTVAILNIEHFRKQLADEKDEVKRRMLLQLLAEEEAKLADIESKRKKDRST
jgi:hypothetical protein